MKITFNREKLAKTLLFVRNAIPKKEIEPILNNFYFKTLEGNNVQIVSTDLDLMSVAYCEGTVESPGEVTIPGAKLLSLVGRLTGDTIQISCEDNSVYINCGAYKGEFKTAGTENYPAINSISEKEALVSFKRESLLSGFKRINFAVNEDEAKKQLMAVQISRNGMVASNGKVTAIYRESFDVDTLCISSNCLKDLIAVMDASASEEVKVFEEDAYLVFEFGDDLFFTRKTSVNFPEVFKRFDEPTKRTNTELLRFKVKDLKSVLQRVSLTASEDTRSVLFTAVTNEEMKISARDSKDFFSEEIMKYVGENLPATEDPISLAFNYDILLEILSKMAGEDIEFKLKIDNIRTPVRIDEGKITIFLMRSVI